MRRYGYAICHEYETWLREERGLATASIDALMWEARHFLAWQFGRGGAAGLRELSVRDIDLYMDTRTPGLRRKSLALVVRTASFAAALSVPDGAILRPISRRTSSGHCFTPMRACPPLWTAARSPRCWRSTKKDTSPMGLRDYAILQFLATYGLRSGEIRNLLLDDIDWRAESLRIRHSKTGLLLVLALDGTGRRGAARLSAPGTPADSTDGKSLSGRARPIGPYKNLYSKCNGGCQPRRQAAGEMRTACLPPCAGGRAAACVRSAKGHWRPARASIDRVDDPLSQACHRGSEGDRARRARIGGAVMSAWPDPDRTVDRYSLKLRLRHQ